MTIYKFTNSSDVTITADLRDTGVYVDTKAENVYKIFDSRYTDDTFIGNSGTQVFRSEGGFDVATGGKGFDVQGRWVDAVALRMGRPGSLRFRGSSAESY